MNLSELNDILKTTGYPVAYYQFKTSPSIPFICYLVTGSNNFSADNKVLAKSDLIDIELYTEKKDIQAESNLEKVLDNACIFYEKNENYIEKENMFQIVYSISITKE